jgi:hypothetical protein
MRATLHQVAPNTYYGHWLGRFVREQAPFSAGQCPLGDFPDAGYPQTSPL